MKRIKNLLVFSFLASFSSLIAVSCSSNETTDTASTVVKTTETIAKVDSSINDTISLGTRTVKKQIAAKSYLQSNRF